jgi:HEAT repeat protein
LAPKELDHLLDLCGRFAQRLTGADLGRIEDFTARFAWRPARRLREADIDGRAKSVMLLSAIGGRRYEPALKAALEDPDPLVAMVAAQAVAKHGLVGQVPRIIERVSALGVWSPAFIAEVVAAVGIAAATPLIEVLGDAARPAAERSTAALALSRLHDPRAADAAAAVLEQGGSRDLVAGCLRIMEEVGRAKHLGPIRRLLHHSDFAVRARAAAALGAMGTAADADLLSDLMGDSSRWVALNAAQGLRRLHRDDLLCSVAAGSGEAALIAAEALQSEVVV